MFLSFTVYSIHMKPNPQIKKPVSKKSPKNSAIKTTWNLELLYKSPKDPQIEKDMQSMEKACADFAKKWSHNNNYQNNNSVLLKVIQNYEQLLHVIESAKPVIYFHLARDIFGDDQFIQSQVIQMDERHTKAVNQIIFFDIALGKISPKDQKIILQDSRFSSIAYYLKQIWQESKYKLSEPIEKVLSLKAGPAYSLWVSATEKIIAQQSVLWEKKQIPIHQATGIVASLPDNKRQKLSGLIIEKLKSISYIPEAELNAVIINKRIDDDLRGFKNPYSATVLEYQNDESAIMTLMNLLHEHQYVAHRLYNLKAKLLRKQKLHYSDIGVTLSGKKQHFSFNDSIEIIKSAFSKVDTHYVDIFKRYLDNGQIDVFARVGKKGGGYCWGGHDRPTYILLNWADELHSVTTLAHELGHGIHAEYSKQQNVFHEKHPISTAEVASTLFENFAFDELVEKLSPTERLYARFNKLQDAVATIFRQSAYFNYELDIHRLIKEKGSLTHSEFAQIMQTRLQEHLGKSFKINVDDGYLWVRYMHARWFFYVYSYAYGQLISTAMYAKYKQDNTFVEKINQFLSAGGSDTPENIFKSIGIDTTKPDFWKIGLDAIEQDIKDLEKECKKLKLI